MNPKSLDLQIAVERGAVSQLESVKVSVTLSNHGPPALVPSAFDLSGALSITVLAADRSVRVASGLTRQEMMVRGRVNATPSLESLGAGAAWSTVLDLGQSMYAPPPGPCRLVAELRLPDGERVVSNQVTLEILAEGVLDARALRDNPVIDGLLVVLERAQAEAPYLIRQYNTAKPLGHWYGEPLPVTARPILARPSYFSSDSFDHFFVRWSISASDGVVSGRPLLRGQPSGPSIEAPLPDGLRLIGSACDHGRGSLEVFARTTTGELVCLALEPGVLRERFRLALPEGIEGDPCVVADARSYSIAAARAGLCEARVERSTLAGTWRQRFNTELVAHSLWIDSVERRIVAAFWDAAVGMHLQLVEASTAKDDVFVAYQEREGPLRAIRELAFDRDRQGIFHWLSNCDEGLFYKRHDQPPSFLLPSAPRRAPLLTARPAVHVGFYDAERGYHLYAFRRGILYREPTPEAPEPS